MADNLVPPIFDANDRDEEQPRSRCTERPRKGPCRRCTQIFDANDRDAKACHYHPQSWSGETAQRWLPPGSNANGGEVHNFWSCCGQASADAPGCQQAAHITFDEPDTLTW